LPTNLRRVVKFREHGRIDAVKECLEIELDAKYHDRSLLPRQRS